MNTLETPLQPPGNQPYDQFKVLHDLFVRATTAEQEIARQKNEIKEVLNTHHTFLDTPTVKLSVAEKATKNIKELNVPVCWGCGGQHSWWNTITKSINCPLKDDPKIQANAAAAFKAHKQKKKA